MINDLYLDLETFNTCPITAGTFKYAETAEIMITSYAMGHGPVGVWDCTRDALMPRDLHSALISCDHIVAHNALFDKTIFCKHYPSARLKPWRCTMAKARMHSLPGALGQLSEIMRLPEDQGKDKAGKKLIQFFCKPQKKTTGRGKNKVEEIYRPDRLSHPEQWAELLSYAGRDIVAMREIDKRLPSWNCTPSEMNLYYLDQAINERGFLVDVDLAVAASAACKAQKKQLNRKTAMLTDGDVGAATQRDKLLAFILSAYGVTLPDMTKSTLERRLEDPALPDPVKELIRIRLESAGTSTSKYDALLKSVSSDGRLRGTLSFCGAQRTGRWAGRRFQPQNLPRPKFKNPEIEEGIAAIKGGYSHLVYDDVGKMASSALRGVLIAPEGKKLVASDLASIEGRVLAWLAGELWKINAYKEYDIGIGYDMYVWAYAKAFSVDPATVTDDQRQKGKPIELALGYGGGVGAFITFAAVYHVDLDAMADELFDTIPTDIKSEAANWYAYSLEQGKTYGLSERTFISCDSIKRLWRRNNPAIVAFWNNLEDGFRWALNNPDRAFRVGHLDIMRRGSWVTIRLPSGRCLSYPGARYINKKINYLGINTYTKQWGPISTYGGKLAENATQSAARDVIASGMVYADMSGYSPVLSVHDEIITEAPDSPEYSIRELNKILSTAPTWAQGLPLDAAGFEAMRYRK